MSSDTRVVILLALYQGAATIREQIDSYFSQSHRNWSLIVSDDGSSDGGGELIAELMHAHPGADVTLVKGPQLGFAQNFLSLLRLAGPDAPFAALSDQDDVWLDHKLERALTLLEAVPDNCPAAYCSRTKICDSELKEIGLSRCFKRAASFQNALVQSLGGGNTMVLNRAALDLLQPASLEAEEIVAHDWWIYQIISGAGGQMIYDAEPGLLYRQHGANAIGANRSFMAQLGRIGWVIGGRFRNWNAVNAVALAASAHRFTPQNRRIFSDFVEMRDAKALHRMSLMRQMGLYRQTRAATLFLWLAALFKRM